MTRGVAGSLVLLVVVAQHGCTIAGASIGGVIGVNAGANTAVVAGAPVEVRFRPLRELAVTRHAGRVDTTYTNVVAVLGRVRQVRGDSLWVVASEVRFPTTRIAFSRSGSPVAMVVRGEATSVQSLRDQAGYGFGGAMIGGLIGFVVDIVLLLIVVSDNGYT